MDGKIGLHVTCKRWMGKSIISFLPFLYFTLSCVCPFFSILIYVYFFMWINKITKHKSHVHCLIMRSTLFLGISHSIPVFMKRNGCFMLSTFLLVNCSVTQCCKRRCLLYSLKERQNFKNVWQTKKKLYLLVPNVDNGNATFLRSKIYFQ